MRLLLSLVTLIALSLTSVLAQSPQNTFEVASIKPSDPDTRGIMFRNSPGTLHIVGATISFLIQQAYDVREFQISGAPGWINSDRYDVMAKIELTAPLADSSDVPDQQKAMEQQRERLRALLEERCHLKIHRETKELQAYVLTAAKGGPKLKQAAPVEADQDGKDRERPRGASLRVGRGQIIAQSVPLDFLVQILARQLGRPVIDKTGLTGAYDFILEWTPESGPGLGPGFGSPGASVPGKEPPRLDSPAPDEPNGPTIFAAIQEQLGLKLESRKAPADIIVIESIEKPSEN
ncbi:MAG TPA: TIGR03435 family protein [Acidobacteriota bacterium]|nr:TIGR03435 family protein [Acidobacteriota bacterium]